MLSLKLKAVALSIFLFCITVSCNDTGSLTQKQKTSIQDSVRKMIELLASDISQKGPVAWLNYFEDTADFFMASEGRLVFPNNDSAKNFINNTLVKNIRKIELRWSNIHIDPITPKFANVAATYHEDITDLSGKTIAEDGYFTGLAEETAKGWQLRNAHWSVIIK